MIRQLKRISFGSELFVLFDFEELHYIEKRRREGKVAVLLPFYVDLPSVQFQILLQVHEPVAV